MSNNLCNFISASFFILQVSYNYKLKFAADRHIENSDYECQAGKGPHGTCKHVAAVLLMVVQFMQNGTLAVSQSCTEYLQTFLKPKRTYQGNNKIKYQWEYPNAKILSRK